MKAYLEKDHKEWDKNLDDLQFALNTSKDASTGITPAFLNFGRKLEPIQTLKKDLINIEKIESQEVGKWVERQNRLKIIKDEVQKNLELANERQAKYYTLRRRPISYEIGEQVLRSEKTLSNKADNIAKKLNKKFEGPFFIKTKISPTIYEIKNRKGKSLGNWNVKDIKKYIEKTK